VRPISDPTTRQADSRQLPLVVTFCHPLIIDAPGGTLVRPVSDEICVALQTAYAADRNDFASHVEHQFPIDGGQLHLG